MTINDLKFEQCFTLPNSNILAHIKPGTVPFNFVNRHSKDLLVTLGDSWSWGYDLTVDNNTNYRLKNVYGNQLAEKLSAAEKKLNKKIKYFIQVNISNEPQKAGINEKDLPTFI